MEKKLKLVLQRIILEYDKVSRTHPKFVLLPIDSVKEFYGIFNVSSGDKQLIKFVRLFQMWGLKKWL